ncbi:short-chain dehydrogenase/reductase [[Mycobacterium] nativiensis]|uniref:Short-chain dehydrogenase/reductase n=1 Tax=[Mycobacterium] nativiensis TaxID=2855503 RepID=A0ABU5XV91_9MYCO|nr:short-chain dehydrogenase/reductase [Mycolicibacter sp. MYC340]MEB3031855.1 short-chain dehydrogenase/reductase [Mycolicibacter sp. MYC340]
MTHYDVRDKVVVITGAGQGIGLAAAKILDARGARVAVLDIDGAKATEAAAGLRDAIGLKVNVRDRAATAAAIADVTSHFRRIDVVVANAGIAPEPATLRSMRGEEFDRVIGVNLTGAFNTVHPALDQVIANHGHVTVIASVAAFAPGAGGSPYMISKAAVEQMGRALRMELAPFGASAGVVYFGVVDTDMTHHTMDDDSIGRDLGAMLPWPLNRRISSEDAGRVIADAIGQRAGRAMAPAGWNVYSLLRGVLNAAMDPLLTRDRRVHDIIRRIEQRRATEN